jgi:hypothetical protein
MITPTVSHPDRSLKDLKKIELVPPDNAGAYWGGVQHATFAITLSEAITRAGWGTKDAVFITSVDEKDLIVSIALDVPKEEAKFTSWTPCLGVKTSNAKRFSMAFYLGVQKPLAKEVIVFGQVESPQKRHTVGIDLGAVFDAVLVNYKAKLKEAKKEFLLVKDMTIDRATVDQIVLATGRNKILPWSRVGQFDTSIPFYDNDQAEIVEVLKKFSLTVRIEPPFRQLDEMLEFKELVKTITGVATADAPAR